MVKMMYTFDPTFDVKRMLTTRKSIRTLSRTREGRLCGTSFLV